MIIIPFGAILVFGIATYLLHKFWKEIKSFLIKAFELVKSALLPSAIAGLSTYIRTGSIGSALGSAGLVALQKVVEKQKNGQYKETIYHREVTTDELPEKVKRKFRNTSNKEVDITEEVQEELQLEVVQ